MPPLTLGAVDESVFVLSIPILVIVGAFGSSMLRTVAHAIRDASARRQVEASRRELAAYVAEGSITPEDARRLIEADPPHLKRRG